ncbi:MAG: hypothetical protein CME64_02440 [Halobacteriovoraceae bacterium]|nr:hypothetical protein [Halobacteriovoraceae bacterium]|tara:strand:+ start:32605 stop:33087 length:483 start_codon:yes stop_codon:yes gene_type:complete
MKKLLTSILTMTTLIGSLNASATEADVESLIGGTVKVTEDFTVDGHSEFITFKFGRTYSTELSYWRETTCVMVLKQPFYEDKTFLAQDKSYLIEDVKMIKNEYSSYYNFTAHITLKNVKNISHITCKKNGYTKFGVESIRSAFGEYLEFNYPEQDFDGSL